MISLISSLIKDGNSGQYILAVCLAYILAVLFAISIHEFSHAFVAYKFGDNTPKAMGRVSLNPARHLDVLGFICLFLFGFGWAKPVQINPSNFKKYKSGCVWVSLAGIISNLLCAFVFSFAYFMFLTFVDVSSNMLLIMLQYLFEYLVIINLSLAIFNFLPIYPLDSYNFIASLSKSDNAFLRFMRNYGNWILIIILVTPIFDIVYSFLLEKILYLFIMLWGLFI